VTQPGGGIVQVDKVRAAEIIVDEHRTGARFRPLTKAFGLLHAEDAYAVQDNYVRLQMQARGTGAAGYKIGLTTKRRQEMCGIDSPIAGIVLQDRIHKSGATVRTSAYGRLGLEFEIAVRLARDLAASAGVPDLADVSATVDAVAPAIELIDDRDADYAHLDALSLIADNCWNAGIVLGEFVRPWPDLAATEGAVTLDGGVIDRGLGSAVLGHPFNAVAWLARRLSQTGKALRSGDIVMTGNTVTTKFPDRGSVYRFELAGLGSVDLSVGL
jgi:2-keto-4-pentenoate hydratase